MYANVVSRSLPMSETTDSTAAAEEFDSRVDHLLQTTCEVARALVDAHQAAMAMIVAGDWSQARKYFSLSDKYALRKVLALRRGEPAPASPVEPATSFVVIEPA
jgi:hypothetical protein